MSPHDKSKTFVLILNTELFIHEYMLLTNGKNPNFVKFIVVLWRRSK